MAACFDFEEAGRFAMKKILLVLVMVTCVFAQDALRTAIDEKNLAVAKKMVKSGEIEEIYCGNLSPKEAVTVYEKLFKQLPLESFNACPNQFTYGYGDKACGNPKALEACTEVLTKLFTEGTAGNTEAIDALGKVLKSALKTKDFIKPVKEMVDTTAWMPCPKKAADKAACMEQCKAQADSLKDTTRLAACETKPEHYVDTSLSVSKPSPLFVMMQEGVVNGYWKSPAAVALKFADLMKANAKALAIADTAIPSIKYVERWADKHLADSTALPGGELFRFCTAWEQKVNEIVAARGFEARCPVFEKFEDPRDKQVYKVKEIGGLHWFVENLNFAVDSGSICYDQEPKNCEKFGRLYTQEVAKTACPEGTRLATDEDWKALEELAGGSSVAAEKLRSNGSDDYAFTVMFGGHANKSGFSNVLGEGAYFWTEKLDDDNRGVARSMFSADKDVATITVDPKFYLSVRCIHEVVAAPADSTQVPSADSAAAEGAATAADSAETLSASDSTAGK